MLFSRICRVPRSMYDESRLSYMYWGHVPQIRQGFDFFLFSNANEIAERSSRR
ncbi:unnamed protein product, partial [Nesidiocoris tenuis]